MNPSLKVSMCVSQLTYFLVILWILLMLRSSGMALLLFVLKMMIVSGKKKNGNLTFDIFQPIILLYIYIYSSHNYINPTLMSIK